MLVTVEHCPSAAAAFNLVFWGVRNLSLSNAKPLWKLCWFCYCRLNFLVRAGQRYRSTEIPGRTGPGQGAGHLGQAREGPDHVDPQAEATRDPEGQRGRPATQGQRDEASVWAVQVARPSCTGECAVVGCPTFRSSANRWQFCFCDWNAHLFFK